MSAYSSVLYLVIVTLTQGVTGFSSLIILRSVGGPSIMKRSVGRHPDDNNAKQGNPGTSQSVRDLHVLQLSYLDDLSSSGANSMPEDNDGSRNKTTSIKPSGYGPSSSFVGGGSSKQGSSGLVPTGRGPMGSYFDNMMNNPEGTSDNDDDHKSGETSSSESRNTTPTKAWSKAYLDELFSKTTATSQQPPSRLSSGRQPEADVGDDDARTDIRNLLTQRSIQSFMFLLEECRDPHSVKWLQEDFLQEPGNLLEYHGTGAGFLERFGSRWDVPLRLLIQEPFHTITIAAKKRGRGQGGWSKNNPFLEERWMELDFAIDPPGLANRILSVRLQIANEWEHDLDLLLQANEKVMESYVTNVQNQRTTGLLFDRTAANLINDQTRFSSTSSSPFRQSNFDLLYNLATQAAVHRLLRADPSQEEFLLHYYRACADEYFDGDLPLGRADDFLEVFLGSELVGDSIGATERILLMRATVLNDWKSILANVQSDHSDLHGLLLSTRFDQQQSDTTVALDDDAENAAFQ